MLYILTLIILSSTCIYIVYPLLTNHYQKKREHDNKSVLLKELLFQQKTLQNTIDELDFDFSTGKLSQTDYDILLNDYSKKSKEIDTQIKNKSGISHLEIVEKLEREIVDSKSKIATHILLCPKCQKEIKHKDRYCSFCGKKLL